MRVLLVTYSERTQFLPMVPLGWALEAAGHEVFAATQPNLAEVVSHSGLTTVPVGSDSRLQRLLKHARDHSAEESELDIAGDPRDYPWDVMASGYRDHVQWWWRVANEPMISDLVRLSRRLRPDLVVWETVSFAGALAAEACGAAHVRFVWSADVFARMRGGFLAALAQRPELERHDPLAEWLGARAAAVGVEFSEALVCGQATVGFLPASLRLRDDEYVGEPPRFLPMRYVPYSGRSVVPSWLCEKPRRPRVCVTLGTSATEFFGGYAVSVQDVLEGLGDLEVEVVATLPEAEQARLERVPGNVRLVEFAPWHVLAPTCAAVVDHGGPSTLCTALMHAVPQLVVPNEFDAPTLAERLAATGAGLTLAPEEANPASVREQVVRLVEDAAIAQAAKRLRDEALAMPSPAEVVRELEALARRPAVDTAPGPAA